MDGQCNEGVHVMTHTPHTDWLAAAATAAEQQGAGNLLRVVLIVMVLGCVLTAWFLLRGYKRKDD
ncbi:hypothetical protein B1H29_24570 [Streptomyces pactum]|uniref:Uncharacterized protein n=2 Tax=Streptomyces pactum TaxID=68249 RepID=A0A1S6JCZ2_9ACTN|nr:hypothetical protein B1H29_24570 [Streptomyces pactum]